MSLIGQENITPKVDEREGSNSKDRVQNTRPRARGKHNSTGPPSYVLATYQHPPTIRLPPPMFPDPLLKHAFPFKEPRLSKMHRAVVDFIYSRSYSFKLPPLSQESWSELAHNAEQRERLQFLGDSHMHGFVARELYTIHPNETPCYYTVITTLYLTSYCNEFGFVQSARSVLTANSTYAHLLCKIGFHDIKEPVKPAGDTFESLLGKYYAERGEAVFVTYAKKFFRPLMDTAGRAHSDYRQAIRCVLILTSNLIFIGAQLDISAAKETIKAKCKNTS